MPLVSITRLRLRSWRYLPGFMAAAFHSIVQARRASGNLAVGTLREAGNVFWTRSLWKDEAAMRSFMESGAHRAAMPKLLEWCDEASVVHWTQDSAEAPTWKEAHRRLQRDGRLSRVKHPSKAHRRFEISPPRAEN
jgi:hypothetical protein